MLIYSMDIIDGIVGTGTMRYNASQFYAKFKNAVVPLS
jgi:hypothetical protein